ncbi:MAG: hypothetical protein J1E83_08340 [Lachnospiraceae bacterium]|nr:hypothetical protein [Lachnospiraceae bacterium]
MEQEIKCKTLSAIFQSDKLFLKGPHNIEFDTDGEHPLHIKVEQCGMREITLTSDEEISVFDLNAVLTRVERLLMIFDGIFIPLSQMQFSKSDISNENVLRVAAENLMKQRLSYFSSANFCTYDVDKLLEFDSILTPELFNKWEKLLEELDVAHQVYLYSLSNSGITVDVKCAFMIELSEPLVEIVKEHTNLFASLKPGTRTTSLKDCLDALITKYGVDIFKRELSDNYEQFLLAMVNSRVRIMHIKREQKGIYLNGAESILYALKMSLLYRRILFELLNIEESYYKEALEKAVSNINGWNDILAHFLKKLPE